MKKLAIGLAVVLATSAGAQSQPAGRLSLTRLDCGTIRVNDLDIFSDTRLYVGQKKTLTDSCYLIRNGSQMLLWETGLPADLVGKPPQGNGPLAMSLSKTVAAQLGQLGLRPADIDFVGISHYHNDHTGQAADFVSATLLMGKGDWEVAKTHPTAQKALAPWVTGGAKVEPIEGDKDVFGDGRVVILNLPGHTPGHRALLVRLASGPVLLSGDLYHFAEQVKNRGVPRFNTDRADTLASMDRFDRLAANLGAKVIIGHEPADVAKLPPFPKAAE